MSEQKTEVTGDDSGLSVERELKIPVASLDALRDRLIELEAERLAPSAFEDNLLFDRDGELFAAGANLRVRSDRHGSRLTFKGPPQWDGDLKIRLEHETRVDDGKALLAVLESLGYEVSRRYQKHREEWQLGSVTIALDHTPIGDFAEFEGEAAVKVAKRCGFDPSSSERRSYPDLYADYHREHPESPPDMVFK